MGIEAHAGSSRVSPGAKRLYERPVVMDLGGLARGAGAPCENGSNATGRCRTGATIGSTECTTGFFAQITFCRSGTTATFRCRTGTQGPTW